MVTYHGLCQSCGSKTISYKIETLCCSKCKSKNIVGVQTIILPKYVPPKRHEYINIKGLKDWTIAIKERDGWECVRCGATTNLHAHHLIPKRADKTKILDMDNGITVCNSCHGKEEKISKSNYPIKK